MCVRVCVILVVQERGVCFSDLREKVYMDHKRHYRIERKLYV